MNFESKWFQTTVLDKTPWDTLICPVTNPFELRVKMALFNFPFPRTVSSTKQCWSIAIVSRLDALRVGRGRLRQCSFASKRWCVSRSLSRTVLRLLLFSFAQDFFAVILKQRQIQIKLVYNHLDPKFILNYNIGILTTPFLNIPQSSHSLSSGLLLAIFSGKLRTPGTIN